MTDSDTLNIADRAEPVLIASLSRVCHHSVMRFFTALLTALVAGLLLAGSGGALSIAPPARGRTLSPLVSVVFILRVGIFPLGLI